MPIDGRVRWTLVAPTSYFVIRRRNSCSSSNLALDDDDEHDKEHVYQYEVPLR